MSRTIFAVVVLGLTLVAAPLLGQNVPQPAIPAQLPYVVLPLIWTEWFVTMSAHGAWAMVLLSLHFLQRTGLFCKANIRQFADGQRYRQLMEDKEVQLYGYVRSPTPLMARSATSLVRMVLAMSPVRQESSLSLCVARLASLG